MKTCHPTQTHYCTNQTLLLVMCCSLCIEAANYIIKSFRQGIKPTLYHKDMYMSKNKPIESCDMNQPTYILYISERTQITQPPLAITEVEKGSVASLQCGVSHDVNVNITWKWYQGQVELNPSDRITIEQDGTLTILSVYSSDSGVYKCQVLSAGGNDERSTNLKVIGLCYLYIHSDSLKYQGHYLIQF